MSGFTIEGEGGRQKVIANVGDLDPSVIHRVGFLIDLETSLPGSNPATPRGGVIERELAPGCNTDFLSTQLGMLGIHPQQPIH